MGTVGKLRESVKKASLKLNELANNEHCIDKFNDLFNYIQEQKALIDKIESDKDE